jgi:recombination protein RecR
LQIESLLERIQKEGTREIIMALSATMEGDTTIFYLSKKLKDLDVQLSTISKGIAIGGELEYADEITLGRSILSRVPYRNQAQSGPND